MLSNNDTFRTINDLQKKKVSKVFLVGIRNYYEVNFIIQLLGVLNRLQMVWEMYFLFIHCSKFSGITVNKDI